MEHLIAVSNLQHVYLDEFYSLIVRSFVFSLAAWKQLGMLYNKTRTFTITVPIFTVLISCDISTLI